MEKDVTTLSIIYYENEKLFEIETKNTSYVFGITENGLVQHLYWGEKVEIYDCLYLFKPKLHSGFDQTVEREADEYSAWGGMVYWEPSLKACFSDNVRDVKLVYKSYSIYNDGTCDNLVITMKDIAYDLEVDVCYRAIDEFDIIERHCVIRNTGNTSITLENAQSAAWSLPMASQYRLTHVTGKWAGETQLRTCVLTEGKKIIESRKGFTSSGANPWFAIDNGNAHEDHGSVWFGALAWSGNWKITLEKTPFNNLRVTGGVNDFDFSWDLKAGETFKTPAFSGGFTNQGFGGMSRKLHKYQQNFILPKNHVKEIRKVLYNSWEATGFDVRLEEQIKLATKAAQIGTELFVIDDGWFGARNSDRAGLGDWYVNKEKFPEGLAPFIEYVNSLGMDFGIWVEPEMVNPDSDLFRAHPDWVYNFPTRETSLGRNQLYLNLAKEEVKDYILTFMTELLGKNNIKFIKWDMNRTISEPGWMEVPKEQQREIWVRHVENLYDIWDKLREKFPQVVFEACAGGGGRIDLGIMKRADQFWTSDNTDAFDRLKIQEGYSYAYCSKAMMCWVTESPNYLNGRILSLKYRFHAAMMGSLGIGADLNKWDAQQLDEAAQRVAEYKEIRVLVQEGDQYRLSSIRETDISAVQYVDEEKANSVAFFFNHSEQFGEDTFWVKLKGLEGNRMYNVIEENKNYTMSGNGLMNIGLEIQLKGDFSSSLIKIKRL